MKNRYDMEKYLLTKPEISQKWLDTRTEMEIKYIYELFKEEESGENEEIDAPKPKL